MSRTIVTVSDSEFFTNINSEELLGELCKKVNAKHYQDKFSPHSARLAYAMTKAEADDAVLKLKTLYGKEQDLIVEFAMYFEPGSTANDMKEFLDYYIECFEKSQGYECLG